jgi:hypothetical protein
MTRNGPAAVWIDRANGAATLTVLDANGIRTFPISYSAGIADVVAGDTMMILWTDTAELHAFFPDTAADVLVTINAGFSVAAEPRADGTFDVAIGRSEVQIFNVTPQGAVSQREDVCLANFAIYFTLRGGTVDATLNSDSGALFVTTRAASRRRALR